MKFLKERFAEIIILVTVVLLTISLSLFVFDCIAYGEITGAVTCSAGELAILNCDREAAWSVSPAEYSASFAVSNDGKTVYFASPKKGKVTLFAASVIDGMPCIEQHSFYNGIEIPDPAPTPTPAPTPKPAPIETLESVIVDNAKGKPAEELTALADSFAFVVDGIDRGVITSPVAARETFRAIYAEKGETAGENTLDDLAGLLEAISGKIDNSTLKALRDDYETAAKAIRSVIPAKEPAKKPATKPKAKVEQKKEEVKDCPDGKCSEGNCPSGKCNTYQYRWGW